MTEPDIHARKMSIGCFKLLNYGFLVISIIPDINKVKVK
ncbi:hypothetical protein Nos7107_1227 [Nostoc sp. PCC 7107]|nr:hypothetical protein Nos7107_1227 [Nostoc sp. PCC 7107]